RNGAHRQGPRLGGGGAVYRPCDRGRTERTGGPIASERWSGTSVARGRDHGVRGAFEEVAPENVRRDRGAGACDPLARTRHLPGKDPPRLPVRGDAGGGD